MITALFEVLKYLHEDYDFILGDEPVEVLFGPHLCAEISEVLTCRGSETRHAQFSGHIHYWTKAIM